MGTPEFAVPSLEILIENKFRIVAVITAADKPQGRGQKLTPSPVKECALRHNIPVLQPPNLKDPEFLAQLKALDANLQVVVAFRMLPEAVWAMPSYGTFNLHGSLLPQYRGAAPINWAIINGEKETGVTTFFLKHEIDTGSIIFQEREPIREDDDVGSVYERLMHKGAGLVLKTVRAIAEGDVLTFPQQDSALLKHAPKIFKETCGIDWTKNASDVRNFIRGLSPYPGAWAILHGKTYKIYRASLTGNTANGTAGEIRSDDRNYLYVRTKDSWLSIDELQPEGKKRMSVQEFFRGNKLT